MKPIVIILGIVFWVIFQVIKANRNKASRGGQNNNNSANSGQNIIDQLSKMANQMGQEQQSARPANQNTSSTTTTPIQHPFWNDASTTPIEADHFNEVDLVAEYNRTREAGTTIQHHTHDYFDETKDRNKAERHDFISPIGHTARIENQTLSATPAKSSLLGRQKKDNPILDKLKDKSAIKQAFVLSEILSRPQL